MEICRKYPEQVFYAMDEYMRKTLTTDIAVEIASGSGARPKVVTDSTSRPSNGRTSATRSAVTAPNRPPSFAVSGCAAGTRMQFAGSLSSPFGSAVGRDHHC